MRRTLAAGIVALVASTLVAPPSSAGLGGVVVARGSDYIPGGYQNTGVVVVPQGSDLEFVNGEAIDPPHTLTSTAVLADEFTPLFHSGVVNPRQRATVAVSALAPGDYDFYCVLHGYQNMHGTLRII